MNTPDDNAKRQRLADDAAIYLTTHNGCLIPLCAMALLVTATVGVAFAQVDPRGAGPDLYPQAAYVLVDPGLEARRTLATMAGRWTVQPEDQACVVPNTQVLLTAPVDEPDAALELLDATVCTLDPGIRIFRQAVPCAQRDGICDVSREPTPQWFDLP